MPATRFRLLLQREWRDCKRFVHSGGNGSGDTMVSSYLICANQRTGSNLLASGLRRTGVAGNPFEYFNPRALNTPFMLKQLGLPADDPNPPDLAGRLDRILQAGTSKNGVFGAKLHWWHLPALFTAIDRVQDLPPPAQILSSATLRGFFNELRFIFLRRENKVAQAISYYRALKTEVWQAPGGGCGVEAPPDVNVAFDFMTIQDIVDAAEFEEDAWRRLLADADNTVLELTYEELAADYIGTMSRVLAFLGFTVAPADIPPPLLQRQHDARSQEWEHLYREQAAVLPSSRVRRSLREIAVQIRAERGRSQTV